MRNVCIEVISKNSLDREYSDILEIVSIYNVKNLC